MVEGRQRSIGSWGRRMEHSQWYRVTMDAGEVRWGGAMGKMNGVNYVPKMMLVDHFLHRQDIRTSILARWGPQRGW